MMAISKTKSCGKYVSWLKGTASVRTYKSRYPGNSHHIAVIWYSPNFHMFSTKCICLIFFLSLKQEYKNKTIIFQSECIRPVSYANHALEENTFKRLLKVWHPLVSKGNASLVTEFLSHWFCKDWWSCRITISHFDASCFLLGCWQCPRNYLHEPRLNT